VAAISPTEICKTADEFIDPSTTHAKAAVMEDFDGTMAAWDGSYNLDPRSAYLNREIGILVDDHQDSSFANDLLQVIETFKARSLLVGFDGKVQNEDLQESLVSQDRKEKLEKTVRLLKVAPFLIPTI
jgi:phosphatidylserine/phosphatidylglycerophosphate/cardiolipin synthase-like enzyme